MDANAGSPGCGLLITHWRRRITRLALHRAYLVLCAAVACVTIAGCDPARGASVALTPPEPELPIDSTTIHAVFASVTRVVQRYGAEPTAVPDGQAAPAECFILPGHGLNVCAHAENGRVRVELTQGGFQLTTFAKRLRVEIRDSLKTQFPKLNAR